MSDANTLFPVFLKLEQFRVLVVGGGKVAAEKLAAVLSNAPNTKVTVVAKNISENVKAFQKTNPHVQLIEKKFEPADLENKDFIIAAVNDYAIAKWIQELAREKRILINVSDMPELCDFYLGSIVQKGAVKIAISTNGQSPTMAKRLREVLQETIPDAIDSVTDDLHIIRSRLNGNFQEKVKKLDELTKVLVSKQTNFQIKAPEPLWQKIVKWLLFAFVFMIIGGAVFSFVSLHTLNASIQTIIQWTDKRSFLVMLLTGFLAQLIDGSLGMGYGTISTTFLLANGFNPAIVSSRVHAARVFSSGVSGYSHHRFGNINKKLFKALVVPGMVGALAGATLAWFAQAYSIYIRLPLSIYTIYLGYYILSKAFKKPNYASRVKSAGWLASIGGFMDAFAGGGWGTLVTSTLLSKRRSPRYVIGSVCLTEFFVVLTSSVVFFILLRSIPLSDIAGLIIGGLIAAPIAARLVGKLPIKILFIAVGSLVILTSLFIFWNSLINIQLFNRLRSSLSFKNGL